MLQAFYALAYLGRFVSSFGMFPYKSIRFSKTELNVHFQVLNVKIKTENSIFWEQIGVTENKGSENHNIACEIDKVEIRWKYEI